MENIQEAINRLLKCDLKGYILIVDRSKEYIPKTTHICRGTFSSPQEGLCKYSPNSFWRNNDTGNLCKLCVKRLTKELLK